MLTLLAGAVVAFAPRRGSRIVAWALAGAVLALVALTLGTPMLPGFKLRAASPWRSMADAYFLFDNWHLLWYAVIALAIAGGRKLVQPPLAPLATIAAVAVACLVAAAIFGEDIGRWLPEARAVNRATLHVAPLLVFLGALLWREWLQPRAAPATAPATIAIPRA
jgi:hypothetical protein